MAEFGFCLPNTAGKGIGYAPCHSRLDYPNLVNTIVECEQLGFDSVLVTDHLIRGDTILECWTTLSSLVNVTSRMRLGTHVICNQFRHPPLLAKMAATLDFISNGRLELAVGAGWIEEEFRAYGYPWEKPAIRIARLREAVELIKLMWIEEKPSFYGRFYQIRDCVCEPKPIQKPHPPIWIGGSGEKLMLRLVAEMADGYHHSGAISPEKFMRKLEVLKKFCREVGRNYDEITKGWQGLVAVAKSKMEVEELVERVKKFDPSSRGLSEEEYRALSDEEYRASRLIGTPDECAEKIYWLKSRGVSRFILCFLDYPSMNGVRLFADEIIPHFKP